MKTLYDLLGVDRHASFSEIEQSYRHSLNEHIAGNRSRRFGTKDQQRLKQMRQAYLLLSSPGKRLEYDLKLDQREHARLRMVERIGTAVGLVLLIAGLAIIAGSYYRQAHKDRPAVPAVKPAADAATVQHGKTVLASSNHASTQAASYGAD